MSVDRYTCSHHSLDLVFLLSCTYVCTVEIATTKKLARRALFVQFYRRSEKIKIDSLLLINRVHARSSQDKRINIACKKCCNRGSTTMNQQTHPASTGFAMTPQQQQQLKQQQQHQPLAIPPQQLQQPYHPQQQYQQTPTSAATAPVDHAASPIHQQASIKVQPVASEKRKKNHVGSVEDVALIPRTPDEETADGRIRNREAISKIRDAWIFKQVRNRQREFTQYRNVSVCVLDSTFL